MAKKMVNFRIDGQAMEKYRAKASLEGKTMSEVVNNLLEEWLEKDVNKDNQLLAAVSKTVSEIVRCKNETVIASAKIDAVIYSLFCAFPDRFQKEFVSLDKLPKEELYVKAQSMHRKADYLMQLWNKKRVAAKKVARAEMAGIIDELNGGD